MSMTDDVRTRVLRELPDDATETFDPAKCRFAELGAREDDPTVGYGTAAHGGGHEGPVHAELNGATGYELHRIIGRGGFAEVWEATQRSLRRTVAVKRLREDVARDEKAARLASEGFRSEARTAAALEHPNIVPAYDAVEDLEGRPQLAMKLVRGTNWREMILEDIDTPLGELLERHLPILIDVAQAVAFAHSRGIIHRDIKPSQVMVGEFGEVLLLDWGLALPCGTTVTPSVGAVGPPVSGGDSGDAETPTWTSCPAGTPAFMAPEQTDATPRRLGRWTDVYLLGGTLYFLLTGTVPRPAMDAAEAFLAAMHDEIEPPRQRAPDREIPGDLEELAMRALQRDPHLRPTATEFVVSLQASLSGANQRRESGSLTRSIQRALPRLEGSYAELSQCLADVARAEGLWRANPAIPGLREHLHERYAVAALHNGDLELARRQAAQLEAEHVRRDLEDRIMRSADTLGRAVRQRRVFFAASVLLAVVLAVVAVKYLSDQRAAQLRLEQQRNAAIAARDQAEGLTAFMLEDLTPDLESLGRLDLLDQVAQNALEYYESVPAEESDVGIMARRSLALRNAGRVLRDQGHSAEAKAAVTRSLEVATALVELAPEASGALAHLADRWLEMGVLMQRTADPDAAQNAFDQAVTLYDQLLAAEPDLAEYRRGLAGGLFGRAFEWWGRADYERALADLSTAGELLEEPTEPSAEDRESIRLLLDVRARQGHVLRDAGQLDAAVRTTREAIAIGESLTTAEPRNVMYRSTLAECWSSLGFALWQANDLEGALSAYQDALKLNSELAEQDPSNQNRQRRLADTQANVGQMQAELRDDRSALRSLSAAVAILEPLVTQHRGQADWSYSLASALLELGQVHSSRGETAAARSAWARAAEVMAPIATQREDLYYLDTYARALLYVGDVERARPIVEDLLSKGWSHPEFEELCRRHGLATEP